jgi:hypothetical protein
LQGSRTSAKNAIVIVCSLATVRSGCVDLVSSASLPSWIAACRCSNARYCSSHSLPSAMTEPQFDEIEEDEFQLSLEQTVIEGDQRLFEYFISVGVGSSLVPLQDTQGRCCRILPRCN